MPAAIAPAEPSPVATPGQDLRAGDIWPDIAGRIDMLAGRTFDQVPGLVRPQIDNDLQVMAARVERPGATGDARATTTLRDIPLEAALMAVRIAALPALTGALKVMAHDMKYDAVGYDSAVGWAYGRGIGQGEAMAVFKDLVAAIDGSAAQRLVAPVGSADFRESWRALAADPRFAALQDFYVAARGAT